MKKDYAGGSNRARNAQKFFWFHLATAFAATGFAIGFAIGPLQFMMKAMGKTLMALARLKTVSAFGESVTERCSF